MPPANTDLFKDGGKNCAVSQNCSFYKEEAIGWL